MTEESSFISAIPLKTTFRAWLVCVTASLFFFYEFAQIMMFNTINPDLMQAFQVTATATGKISSAYFVANIIFMFPAGVLLDRFSTRKIIIAAMILCVIGTLMFSFSTNIYMAMLCRFLTGIGGSFPFLCCLRLSSRWFPAKRWALVSGLIVTIAFLGGAAGQTPMTFLVNYMGWRHALQLDAFLGVLFTGLITLIVFDYPPNYQPIAAKKQPVDIRATVRSALQNPQNWYYGLYTSMLNLPVMLLGAIWGSLYLMQVFHLSRTQASLVTSMIFFGTIFGSPAVGWLSDRMGVRKLPMIIFGIISLALMLFIMYSIALSFDTLMTLFFILGFVTSAQIISYPAISESNAHEMTGSALGLASVLIMIAPAVFQPLFGWLMDLHWNGKMVNQLPIYTISDFHNGLLIMPIAFVVGIIMVLLAKETYCRIANHLQANK
ncbi:MAG: hypothetical protein A3E87_01120 [Gammaproteobacteria bacterium RIFCSPHIGHO2_12_FULL_35_23]|nr:MAG: hypothetical protein A3E87_01120 [Gammaproteobacteria bacterium RIFCSPHIGHO2_12_FULL_35_23]